MAFGLILLLTSLTPALAARLALVIGNDGYQEVTRLEKARNDARAMGEALEALGFRVSLALDATRRDMNRAIEDFNGSVSEGDIAVFFFAGHGVEIDGENFLLPVDTPDAAGGQADFIANEAIGLDNLLERMRSRGAQLNIVILDACRNNPFSGRGTRSLGGAQGLARISAPQGTFVMYSADVGEAALDRLGEQDANPNSVFTRTLIPLLKQPGLDLVDTAREVRRSVRQLASTISHQQTPAYYDAVLGDFFFSGGEGTTQKPAETPKEKPQQARTPDTPMPVGRSMIVTSGEKDSLRLWDADSASLIAELEGEKISFSSIAFIDGGRSLAVAADDGALFAYALPAFKKTAAIYPGFKVTSIAQAEDRTLYVGGATGELSALSADGWKTLWHTRPHGGIVAPVLVRDGGKTLLTASADGAVLEISAADGSIQRKVDAEANAPITDIAIVSPAIVAAAHENGFVSWLNLSAGKPLSRFRANTGWISSIDLTPDGASVVTAGVDGELAFFTLGTDAPTARIAAHKDVATAAKFLKMAAGDKLVSSSFDGLVRIWDIDAGKPLATLEHGSAIAHFDFHQGQ
jgi:uncharacterized caspase-like protein